MIRYAKKPYEIARELRFACREGNFLSIELEKEATAMVRYLMKIGDTYFNELNNCLQRARNERT